MARRIHIVGGGPTGLLLGCLCADRGWSVRVFERRVEPVTHSRSIGIHPPSLALFERLGILSAFLQAGNRIDTGAAFLGARPMGRIDFANLGLSHPFILTLAQSVTEQILTDALLARAPNALRRGCAVTGVRSTVDAAILTTADGAEHAADFVVICEGHGGTLRATLGDQESARPYPHQYVMGDFVDQGAARHEARVHICAQGLVESFPHGANQRRWVLRVPQRVDPVTAEQVTTWIHERIGVRPDPATCSMVSGFQPHRRGAKRWVYDRVILAGDAAHVVSPIGGQGMNLGWLDAAALTEALADGSAAALRQYQQRGQRRARQAMRRAEFNMACGRPFGVSWWPRLWLWLLMQDPIKRRFGRAFTMQGLA